MADRQRNEKGDFRKQMEHVESGKRYISCQHQLRER